MSRIVRINNHTIELTHEDKLLFPEKSITKGDVIAYYHKIAPYMISHMRDRPLAMQRFLDNGEHDGFYQKEAGSYFPSWIKRVTIKKKVEGVVHYVLCNDTATLVYLANQGVLVYHVWPTKIDKLRYPDRMIFDLDPSGKATFSLVRWTAQTIKELLDELDLVCYVMTTGSRGVHVVVPLARVHTFDKVRACARAIAQHLVSAYPKQLTLEMSKSKRGNKIFLDVIRNTYGHHSVAPYSIRALPGAPIATPITWKELSNKQLTAQRYTINNIFRRLASVDDPWADMTTHRQHLDRVVEKLKEQEE